MRFVVMSFGLLMGQSVLPAQASVFYSFIQSSFTPSVISDRPSGFVLKDTLVVSDADLISETINRTSSGIKIPDYALKIGPTGALTGTINGLLDPYEFKLASQANGFLRAT